MHAILHLMMTLPTLPDVAGAGQACRRRPGRRSAASSFSVAASSRVRLRARSAASSGVSADDQPFAAVVGVADLGQVLGVEQAHLQRPVLGGQFGDRGRAQRGDPAEIRCGVGIVVEFAQRADAGGGDHAAIVDQHQRCRSPSVSRITGDDLAERARVGGVAGKHPHRHRAPFGVGEDPVFDLLAALLAVAGVAARGQLAAPPGHPGRGQVEQRHPPRVHRRIQMFVRRAASRSRPAGRPASPSPRRSRRCSRRRHPDQRPRVVSGHQASGGQLRRRAHYPRDDQRPHQISCPARRPQQARASPAARAIAATAATCPCGCDRAMLN